MESRHCSLLTCSRPAIKVDIFANATNFTTLKQQHIINVDPTTRRLINIVLSRFNVVCPAGDL